MKKTAAWLAAMLLTTGLSSAGVVKSSKSEISFKSFGKFSMVQAEKVVQDRKLSDTTSDFKGKGVLGGLAGKTFLRSGRNIEIIDLPAMTIYQIDQKKKEYTAKPIEKIVDERAQAAEKETAAGKQAKESRVKIIRTEFKVTDTGESQVINQFPCKKYEVKWLVEWEDLDTGQKGTERLDSLVWTTPMSEMLRTAQSEESVFYNEYMKKIGLDMDKAQKDILGTEWLSLLSTMSAGQPGRGSAGLSPKGEDVARELKKIQGYPIVTDGKYFSEKKGEPAEKREEVDAGGLKGGLGKFAMKALKKKPAPEEANAPNLSFYTEITSLEVTAVDASEFQVPAGYKKKG